MSDKLPPRILVIEPDEVTNANLCNTIERYRFDVIRAKNFEAAIRAVEVETPHVAIISSRLQDRTAIEMAVTLRKKVQLEELPIIFLIEKMEASNNYHMITGSYNEFIHRPFTTGELMTSIRSLLRKSNPVFQDKIVRYNDILIDLSTYKVIRGGKQIHLGPTEFKILHLLMQKPHHIYPRKQIIDYVWGADKDIAPRTIDVHINRLRNLMKLDSDRYPIIKTIRAAGYCLD